MKTKYIIALLSFFAWQSMHAQDTLSIYKNNQIVYKTDIASIDSMQYIHINHAPVAVKDSAETNVNVSVSITPTLNDYDIDNDFVKLVHVNEPKNGNVQVDYNTGIVTYIPNKDFIGLDYFTYDVFDGDNGYTSGEIVIRVNSSYPYQQVTINPWYIIGLDGLWNNSTDGIGSSLIPLSVVSGNKYDKNGNGEFVYTGYFKAASGFKIINHVGFWDVQWGNNGVDGINSPVMNVGASHNFKVPSDGYYKITLNSIKNTLTIVPVTITPTVYNLMGVIGSFNNWAGDVIMTGNASAFNHIWYVNYTFTSNTEYKFRANAAWDVNWGSEGALNGNPLYQSIGLTITNGKNISANQGTYRIIFNDIDGCYYVIKK